MSERRGRKIEEAEVAVTAEAPADVVNPEAAMQEQTISEETAEVSVDIATVDLTAMTEERPAESEDATLKAVLEAIVYITDEPLSAQQIAAAIEKPMDLVKRLLDELVDEYTGPSHGLSIREVAGGYKMATKAEHHEAVRGFVKKLTPPLKLSLAALETLAVIAYKQPVTAPEIMDIRGVQGASVLKTLLDRRLVAEAGRKNVVGKPILYKTTKEFLVQFGLKSVSELPTLKEFEELARMSADETAIESEVVAGTADGEMPTEEKSLEGKTLEEKYVAAAAEHEAHAEPVAETAAAEATMSETEIAEAKIENPNG